MARGAEGASQSETSSGEQDTSRPIAVVAMKSTFFGKDIPDVKLSDTGSVEE